MKDAIKMYHLFLPRKWWMLLVYIAYPMFVGLITAWCFNLGFEVGSMISLMFATSAIVCVEYILDTYMLFGIAAKDNRSLEYMKSSSKGVNLLKISLCADGVRRIVTTIVMFSLVYGIMRYNYAYHAELLDGSGGVAKEYPRAIIYVQCAIIALFLTETGLILTRRTKNVLRNLLIVYLMSAISCPLVMAAVDFANGFNVMISVVVLCVIWIMGRRFLIKKVRESFYDEGHKELFQTT